MAPSPHAIAQPAPRRVTRGEALAIGVLMAVFLLVATAPVWAKQPLAIPHMAPLLNGGPLGQLLQASVVISWGLWLILQPRGGPSRDHLLMAYGAALVLVLVGYFGFGALFGLSFVMYGVILKRPIWPARPQ